MREYLQLKCPRLLKKNSECEIVALCDTLPGRAAAKAREWGISPKIYTDFNNIISDANVDAVELLTPTPLHSDQIIKALNAGKHVSCQKPLTSSISEAKRIKETVLKSKTLFRITENFLYYPPILKAKELIDAGEIGEPSLIRIRTIRGKSPSEPIGDTDRFVLRQDSSLNPGGNLYDDGWHKYATAVSWVGKIEKVTSIVTKTDSFLDETPSAIIMKIVGKDCLVTIDYSSAPEMPIRTKYFPLDEFFEIVGPKETIWVTRCTGEMLDMAPVVVVKGDHTKTYNMPTDWIEGFNGSADSFINAVLHGTETNMNIDFSIHVLNIALSIYESSDKERTIYL
jgi:predicted dehydrogenase